MVAAARNIRHHVSPTIVLGAASISLVIGISILRYASAAESHVNDAHSFTSEIKAEAATANPDTQPTADTPAQVQTDGGTNSANAQQNESTSQGSVTVNGKTYTVPGNGELHTTTSDANGQTSINISVQSSGSNQTYNSSSSHVHVSTNSSNVSQSTGSSAQ